MWQWTLRESLVTAFCLSALGIAGCGGGDQRGYVTHNEALFPVKGKILVAGKPAKNAAVTFHRTDNPQPDITGKPVDGALRNPIGRCNEEGEFEVFTYLPYDGAPEGEYLVTVSWSDPDCEAREDERYPQLLPKRFQSPELSGLKVEIVEGDNDLPPIELKP